MTRFDLHIHTALSACGENTMSPRRILDRAGRAGLNLLAVADHNASAHVPLLARLAEKYGITVIPAIEVTTREETHLLAYFSELAHLAEFQGLVDRSLPNLKNDSEIFGWQLIYDDENEIVGVDEQLRQIGTDLDIQTLTAEIHRLSGYAVPAHVFRYRYSLTSQLGFIDQSEKFDALEVGAVEWHRRQLKPGTVESGFPVISGSDSHFLEDIGRNYLEIQSAAATLSELFLHLAGES